MILENILTEASKTAISGTRLPHIVHEEWAMFEERDYDIVYPSGLVDTIKKNIRAVAKINNLEIYPFMNEKETIICLAGAYKDGADTKILYSRIANKIGNEWKFKNSKDVYTVGEGEKWTKA